MCTSDQPMAINSDKNKNLCYRMYSSRSMPMRRRKRHILYDLVVRATARPAGGEWFDSCCRIVIFLRSVVHDISPPCSPAYNLIIMVNF